MFLAIFQVIQCLCLIFQVLQFCRHYTSPTVCISHISRFSLFLTIFHVLKCVSHFASFSMFFTVFYVLTCVFLIFLICQFSHHILGPTMWVSHFPHWSVFSWNSQSYSVHFHVLHVFECFSPYSRSYSVCVLFSTFFQFSHHNPCTPVCIFYISRFSLFLAIYQILQCVFLICTFYKVSWHIPGHTLFASHFLHFFSVFLPQSRSFSVYFLYFTYQCCSPYS